ncbi:MAG: hypothetical protein U5N85_20400 [Arcicella sp.]|nr:hypothetical protein [Arcicella sp.]
MPTGAHVLLTSTFANDTASSIISVRFNDTRTAVASGAIPGSPTAPVVFRDAEGSLGEGIVFSATTANGGPNGRPQTRPLAFSATYGRLLADGADDVAAAETLCGVPVGIRVAAGTLVASFEQASTGCSAVAVFGSGDATSGVVGWNATRGVEGGLPSCSSPAAMVLSIAGTRSRPKPTLAG